MKKAKLFLIAIALLTSYGLMAQIAVTTDGTSADASAMLDVKSTEKGMLIPRMTGAERDAITTPATGLMVFVTDEGTFYFYDGIGWSLFGGSRIPVGTIQAFAGTTIPDGWLLCDGSEINRSTYSSLFAIIDIYWGAGNGSNTFHLPDLRGRFLRGVDNGTGNDPDAASRTVSNILGNSGDNVGSLQDDAFQSHTHNIQSTNQDGSANANTNGGYGGGTGWHPLSNPVEYGGGGSPRYTSETRPKNVNVNYIIKY